MNADAKTHLMVKVAKEYFEVGKTQQEIAGSLRISRSSVSRLLTRAREEGIVQIAVDTPAGIYFELEKKLEKTYGLIEAIVIETRNYDSQDSVALELGQAAANYLDRTVQKNDVIGFAWGTTMKAMVDSMQPRKIPGIKVFQMNGGTEENPQYQLGSPIFDKVRIQLNQEYYPGKEFTIKVIGNSAENVYIQSSALNKNPFQRYWINHKDLVNGGELILNMGPNPNMNWGK